MTVSFQLSVHHGVGALRIGAGPMHDRLADDDDERRPVMGYAYGWPTNEKFSIEAHRHLRAQLIYATAGVLRVSTADCTWVLPPQQAVWVPADVVHSVTATGSFDLRTLYLHPAAIHGLAEGCCVITVSPLLRELILHAIRVGPDYALDGADARILSVIPDLLGAIAPEPLQLPLPRDRRLRIVTDALLENPSDNHPLSHWAKRVGASERTLLRHFNGETGLSYLQWRKRLRLLQAITLLSKGCSVTATAYELGYEGPSAFVAMFRRELGVSPRRYLALNDERERGAAAG
ncbi:hypothetical protein B9N43_02590 [Denitratisoma sp. DHT3]|uniref:AraC family transcriptional regulator n=1 Tax=Denitratisoma sp. DHT3 TaxID=1981880 RepID=UPI001198CA8F|nr:helix-turn-helix transcriptional regulator [Denitratisoma sp. DHT3]QDX80247.1 hypothetical protein B9N43_02590 [Denitratisoma sp. DHT3]